MSAVIVAAALVIVLTGPPLRRMVVRPAPRRSGQRTRAAGPSPELFVLLAIGLGSGRSLLATLELLADQESVPEARQLRTALATHQRGAPIVESLTTAGFADLAPLVRAHVDDGAAIGEALIGYAGAIRDEQRRRSEEAARRLPVRMLIPLVTCTLPGFLALTVAPVVVDAIRTIELA